MDRNSRNILNLILMTQYILPKGAISPFPIFYDSFTCPCLGPHVLMLYIFKESDQIKTTKCACTKFVDVIFFFKCKNLILGPSSMIVSGKIGSLFRIH